AASAFLPAAKSGSSCAQSDSDPIIGPRVVQIGQSSSGIFASATRWGAPSHAAMGLGHRSSIAADRAVAPTSAPSTTANMIQRFIVAPCAPSAGLQQRAPADFYHLGAKYCLASRVSARSV